MSLIKGIHHVSLKCCGEDEYNKTVAFYNEVFNDICIPSEPAFPARMAFCYGPLGEEIEFFCEK